VLRAGDGEQRPGLGAGDQVVRAAGGELGPGANHELGDRAGDEDLARLGELGQPIGGVQPVAFPYGVIEGSP
jgi:hypothetical protein